METWEKVILHAKKPFFICPIKMIGLIGFKQ